MGIRWAIGFVADGRRCSRSGKADRYLRARTTAKGGDRTACGSAGRTGFALGSDRLARGVQGGQDRARRLPARDQIRGRTKKERQSGSQTHHHPAGQRTVPGHADRVQLGCRQAAARIHRAARPAGLRRARGGGTGGPAGSPGGGPASRGSGPAGSASHALAARGRGARRHAGSTQGGQTGRGSETGQASQTLQAGKTRKTASPRGRSRPPGSTLGRGEELRAGQERRHPQPHRRRVQARGAEPRTDAGRAVPGEQTGVRRQQHEPPQDRPDPADSGTTAGRRRRA